MFDDFFIRALFAGIGIAFVTGPLGCFVVWRRLSYFGDTLAHSALLGVTMAYSFELNIAVSVFLISSVIALILIQLQKKTNLPGDALLGLLAHSSLAVGLVVIGFLTFIRFDIMGLLFGDILAVTVNDLIIIWFGGALILLVLKLIWKPLFASTVNYELAEAEGLNPDRAKAIFTILMAAIIAISIKMVGLLLITGMLIIPAAMARNISDNPQKMVLFSVIGGLLSVIIGLFSSLEFNTASGPSIITASLILFILSLLKIKQSIQLKNWWTNGKILKMQKQQYLTKNQQIVLDLVEKSNEPLKAYSILFNVQKKGIKAPLQVYRALDKLVEIGKIHKIESRNAFIACQDSSCQISKATAFSICESCEKVTEINNSKLSNYLNNFKDNSGMKYSKYNLEFFGLCKKCIKK